MIENAPLVSVIIPVYNAEKYVEQAVRSIMKQTYQNLEILITDDCSTDGSFAILQKLAKEDSRIKLFTNEHNQKIVRTLNALVERAKGKYIARMDADDISLQKRIEKQVCFMEAHPDIAICGTNAWHIDETGKLLRCSHLPASNDDIQTYKLFACPFYHPTVLANALILKNNKYDENYLYAEDFELWLRILAEYKAINLKKPLLCYRILPNSISSNHSTKTKQKHLSDSLYRFNHLILIKQIRSPIAVGALSYSLLYEKKVKKSLLLKIALINILYFMIIEVFQRLFIFIYNHISQGLHK